MPFPGPQYLYVEGDVVVISTNFNPYKKKVIPVTTKNSFFVGLSRLNLKGIDRAVLEAFPARETYSSSCYDNDYDNDCEERGGDQIMWNPYLDTYTMGGI